MPQERILKIAVTGATGFIGRHVLAELASHKIKIIAITRPGHKDLPALNNGTWVTIDLCHPSSNIYEAMGMPDVLIHLAWHGLPDYLSLRHFETELPLQYEFLKQIISQGLKSIVITGTCLEYGMQSGSLAETIESQPNNPYGFAKYALREQLQYLHTVYTCKMTWARLFYMYGEGQPKTSLLPQLKKAIQENKKQFNMSGGEQLRDYLPVSEVAYYLVALALKQQNIGTINVCSGKPQSVRGIVEQWIRENKWNIKLNLGHYPYPNYEPMAFWGDRQRLDSIFVAQKVQNT